VLFILSCQASGYPLALTDSDGRELIVRAPFSRIISLYPAHTENLVSLGASRKIVGVSRSSGPIPGIPKGCRTVSYRDDLERLLVLKPDLVLIRPMISRSHPNLVRGLEKSGITVVSLQPTSPEAMYRYWRKLGILAGRPREAEDMILAFRQELERLKGKVDLIPRSMRQRVYFEAIHRRMKTFAPGSLQIFCLESAGGINVASDARRVRCTNIAQYGKEKILSKSEEIDVYLAQRGRMNPVTREEIMSEPGFQVIKAVRQGRVYLVEEAIVSRPTPRLLEGMKRIFHILYPARGAEREN
jgi:iron complex transport system substrate-binding protein